ncbi:MAG: haloalkane dehalogenase [Gemmatimonadota bacterium]|nr:haloalkane dehalogenase [Gemmatimonadota bacterium]
MNRTAIAAEFPFESRFVTVNGSEMHYVEAGEGDPILFLHGNPTSSYLWRNIIPHVSGLGRAIAPDLIGMGKSDKPDSDYGFFDHYEYVEGFIDRLGLRDLALVIHDWGSALGFHYAHHHSGNVKGIAFMEAIVAPVPSWDDFHPDFQKVFKAFRTEGVGWDMIVGQNFFVEKILPGAVARDLTEEEMAHYRAPFLEEASRKPTWRWPNEIPIEGHPPDVADAVGAYNAWLQETEIPKLLLHAMPGALIRPEAVEWCKAHLPNLETVDIGTGIHFVQEDAPHEIGRSVAEWYARL